MSFEFNFYNNFSHDFLYMYDGGTLIEEQTGILVPTKIKFASKEARIRFTSDHVGTSKGFHMDIDFIVKIGEFSNTESFIHF